MLPLPPRFCDTSGWGAAPPCVITRGTEERHIRAGVRRDVAWQDQGLVPPCRIILHAPSCWCVSTLAAARRFEKAALEPFMASRVPLASSHPADRHCVIGLRQHASHATFCLGPRYAAPQVSRVVCPERRLQIARMVGGAECRDPSGGLD
mmetsp:Transcript_60400/g.179476  ORF Transcript_60400/g.179476 Transcript_60400/m.179476 type:complete len:150 (+) Transcript_60400:543-992(+)